MRLASQPFLTRSSPLLLPPLERAPKGGRGVEGVPPALPVDLEVEMRTGRLGIPRIPHVAQHVAGLHAVTVLEPPRIGVARPTTVVARTRVVVVQVGVEVQVPVVPSKEHGVPTLRARKRGGDPIHRAVHRRQDRRPPRHEDVLPLVRATARSPVAPSAGEARRIGRQREHDLEHRGRCRSTAARRRGGDAAARRTRDEQGQRRPGATA